MLEYLWQAPDADVGQTHAAVGVRRGISPNTVGSALERLHKKALVRRRKVSHAYRYRAALTREELALRRVMDLTGGRGGVARAGLLAAFVDMVAEVDEASLDRLEELVAQKRRERQS